jgi:hypothetical protein
MAQVREKAHKAAHPVNKVTQDKIAKKTAPAKSKRDDILGNMHETREQYLFDNHTARIPNQQILAQCINSVIAYANFQFGNARTVFGQDIAHIRASDASKYTKPSLADNMDVQVGDFIAQAYPYPAVEGNRDQLVIDTMTRYANTQENKNTDLYNMSDIISLMSNLCSFVDKINKSKEAYHTDPIAHEMALDTLFGNFNPQADYLVKCLGKTKDPQLKALADTIKEVKRDLTASMPVEYKEKKAVVAKAKPGMG